MIQQDSLVLQILVIQGMCVFWEQLLPLLLMAQLAKSAPKVTIALVERLKKYPVLQGNMEPQLVSRVKVSAHLVQLGDIVRSME